MKDEGQLMQMQLRKIRERHEELDKMVMEDYWFFQASQAEKDRRDLLGHIGALEAKLARASMKTHSIEEKAG